ncbi:MAG: putative Zn-dependent protease [Candidatus Bathyarchaeota archaeon B24]|nr:MAG: putative Zn-dependent protease [Candidatus Bathyarchaeota archaeon B24]
MLAESMPIFLLKPDILLVTLTGMLTSFLIHELAHKLAAQRMGYWAEFRLSISGLFMTLLSIILPIKIVAPGAVKVIGLRFSKEDVGKVALMGPLTNVVQAVIYIALRRFVAFGSLMSIALHILAVLNLSLALFNLIPFGPLDGAKVFRWSRSVWFSVLVSVLAVWLSLSTPF